MEGSLWPGGWGSFSPHYARRKRPGKRHYGPDGIVQEAVRLVGLSDPEAYSAHSLRAGHATQATKNGVPAEIAMQTTRHESREQFSDYVRNDEKAFEDASSGKLGL